jgi:flagellum-specific ATP synthase
MATYEDMAELIRLGAYRKGSDPQIDEAITFYEPLETFLKQEIGEVTDLEGCYQRLGEILGMPYEGAGPAGQQHIV